MNAINIILDEKKQKEGISPDVLFVKIELDNGKSINIGERSDYDGLTKLRITAEEIFEQNERLIEMWAVWTNRIYPFAYCRNEATALRLKKEIDGYIQKVNCFYNGYCYAPTRITESTSEDDREQKKLDKKNNAIEKALSFGLSEEDIENIQL